MSAAEFKAVDPLAPFTREHFLRMSPDQVTEFWLRRQRALRGRGEDHFTRLVDPDTGAVVAEI